MLRISDPTASLNFYQTQMGMTLLDRIDFNDFNFSLYFLASMEEPYALTPGSTEAHKFLWSFEGTTLELTHNHLETGACHPSNEEGDGFGHVAFHVDDVYATVGELEKEKVEFKKLPDAGRMKGLAFAYDADRYWVEIIKRSAGHSLTTKANLSQTMLRVKDPTKSVPFYEALGMTLLQELHFGPDSGAFSLFFLACLKPGEAPPPFSDVAAMKVFVNSRHLPVLELTHNHGTESDAEFKHFNGNEEGKQGFGHIGYLVDDVEAAVEDVRTMGYGVHKESSGGMMKGLAFVK